MKSNSKAETEVVAEIPIEAKSESSEKRMLRSATILERMINLNTYVDIAHDFRYYDDPSDELKISDVTVEGSVLPLWTFTYSETCNLEVTGLCWNHLYPDLLGVSYGSYSFYDQPNVGFIRFYSLKNPSHPEYILETGAGVMCLDCHHSQCDQVNDNRSRMT